MKLLRFEDNEAQDTIVTMHHFSVLVKTEYLLSSEHRRVSGCPMELQAFVDLTEESIIVMIPTGGRLPV